MQNEICFGGALEASRTSRLVDPELLPDLPKSEADRNKCFAVFNEFEKRVLHFIYTGSSYVVYVLSFLEGFKRLAWSKFADWDYEGGCKADDHRIYFFKGTQVIQYGNTIFANEDYQKDNIARFDSVWATTTSYVTNDLVQNGATAYRCLVAHTSGTFATDLAGGLWEENTGTGININWIMPWSDFGKRGRKKKITGVHFDTEGVAQFYI